MGTKRSYDPLREPFQVNRTRFGRYTPIRNPWLMLAVGIVVEGCALLLAVWAITADIEGRVNLSFSSYVGLFLLVVIPIPILLIGISRVRWMFRYRRITGKFPVPSR
jgi:uncharacterized membrane protein YidH (DUF202 family)